MGIDGIVCIYIYVDYMIRFHFLNHGIMTIYYGFVWFMVIYNGISPSTNDEDIWCFYVFYRDDMGDSRDNRDKVEGGAT